MGRNINKNGLLGTIIFHGIIAAILLLLGFHTPLPLPEEKGILISFGDSPQGKGKPSAEKQTQKAKPNTGKTTPPPKKEKPKSNNPIKPTSAPKILTQNIEEAPAIKSGNAKKKKEEIRKKREEKNLRNQREAERKKLEEEKRIRQEQERIRKEREEQIKREEEEKRKEEERKKKFAESMNTKAKNLFKKSNSNSSGYGDTDKSGNQGSQSGDPKGEASGTGKGDSGISYDLKGRNAEYIHQPQISFSKGGKVIVEVIVDNTGKVVRATPGAIGTTTSNQTLYKIAKESALKTRFNSSSTSPKHQKGTITYIFIVK